MNNKLASLHPYPFEKLNALYSGLTATKEYSPIKLSIGEPKHASPEFVLKCMAENLDKLGKYPSTKGLLSLREAIATWLEKRFSLSPNTIKPEQHILPVNGTREALFSFVQACFDADKAEKHIVMPNPFYQIYEGAAILAGGQPLFLNCTPENGFTPNFDAVPDEQWEKTQIVFICSPGNPTGALYSLKQMKELILLADKHDFIIASDECYSEIYRDEKHQPAGLLQACAALNRNDYERCIVFHSLSKRSNLPGLRSGFVAGDANILEKFLLYRTYHGCAMSLPTQLASIAAWNDEIHVKENRYLYQKKFDYVGDILKNVLDFEQPEAGFYLWPKTPIDDELFSKNLFKEKNVTVLPGKYLSRETNSGNPGERHVRMALVAELEQCIEAAERIKQFMSKTR